MRRYKACDSVLEEVTTPEQNLCIQMLRRAVWDLFLPDEEKDARKWIFSSEPDEPFSFDYCCDQVGYNPNTLRTKVKEEVIKEWIPPPRKRINASSQKKLKPESIFSDRVS